MQEALSQHEKVTQEALSERKLEIKGAFSDLEEKTKETPSNP